MRKSSLTRSALAALLIVGAGAAFVWAYERGFVRFNYPSEEQFPVRGIDVSHHQGVIEWARVGADGIEFVYLKASEGTAYKDPQFRANWTYALRAGLKVGAYHYYRFCDPPAPQAANFLAVLPVGQPMLPPVVDVEFANCPGAPNFPVLFAKLKIFSTLIAAPTGVAPIIYFAGGLPEGDLVAAAIGGEFWPRAIVGAPNVPWRFWQYANNGRVSGIEGAVDLDVFRGSRQDWQSFVSRGGKP